ncbi:MAG: QueG-associated DUF1730 domain-containing protein, partial [Pyrinomonadaceae bacterium]
MPGFARRIKEKAAEIGFQKLGIVPAAALNAEGERLAEWLGLGYQGEMAWLEREPEKRTDPRLLYPGVRSVIVVALNYHTLFERTANSSQGKISRYAW